MALLIGIARQGFSDARARGERAEAQSIGLVNYAVRATSSHQAREIAASLWRFRMGVRWTKSPSISHCRYLIRARYLHC